jgi:hypothetical protein
MKPHEGAYIFCGTLNSPTCCNPIQANAMIVRPAARLPSRFRTWPQTQRTRAVGPRPSLERGWRLRHAPPATQPGIGWRQSHPPRLHLPPPAGQVLGNESRCSRDCESLRVTVGRYEGTGRCCYCFQVFHFFLPTAAVAALAVAAF